MSFVIYSPLQYHNPQGVRSAAEGERACPIDYNLDMMIHFYGTLRQMAGEADLICEHEEGQTISQVMQFLAGRYPALRDVFFNAAGQLEAQMPVFINGRNPRLLPLGLDTLVHAGDTLSLFSPIASGRMNVETIKQAMESGKRARPGNEN